MAKPRVDDYEYLKYLRDQAELMSQIDGIKYDFNGYNSPEQIEQRLLTGEVPKTAVKQQPPKAQPLNTDQPKLKQSKLGWIMAGFDIE